MTLQWEHAVIGVLVFLLAMALGKWLFKKDTQQEIRLKGYASLATVLSKVGFKRLPRLLVDLAVKDVSGAFHELKELQELALDEPRMRAELFGVLHTAILESAKDPSELLKIRSLLNSVVTQASANAQALVDATSAPTLPAEASPSVTLPGHTVNIAQSPPTVVVTKLPST